VPRMAQGIHSPPLGHIATMLKDLDTVIDVARETSSPVPMSALAAQLFRLAKSARGADADALEIYKLSAVQIGCGNRFFHCSTFCDKVFGSRGSTQCTTHQALKHRPKFLSPNG
jgi:NAD-binding of NADP-dependent 3-hydroxyisobutyrate dehydrogenase